MWVLTQMALLLAIGWTLDRGEDVRWLLAICSYVCFFSGVPTVILRRIFKSRTRTAYLRACILLFIPLVGILADLLQYLWTPSVVFDGTFSGYHILNPFRALANWRQIETLGWQWRPMVMGAIGLLAYLELCRMGRREDKHAANPS